jgi:hypothetical protein
MIATDDSGADYNYGGINVYKFEDMKYSEMYIGGQKNGSAYVYGTVTSGNAGNRANAYLDIYSENGGAGLSIRRDSTESNNDFLTISNTSTNFFQVKSTGQVVIYPAQSDIRLYGNVTVGTHTAPTQQLHVEGNANITGNLTVGGPIAKVGNVNICLQNGTGCNSTIAGNVTGSGEENYTARWTSSTNLGTGTLYDDGTNVGIGLTNPSAFMHIKMNTTDSTVYGLKIENSAGGNLMYVRGNGAIYFGSGSLTTQVIIDSTNVYAGFYGNSYSSDTDNIIKYKDWSGNQRMTLDMSSGTNGKLGITDTTPDAQLDVEIALASNTGLIVQGAASQTANLTEWRNSSGSALSYIDANGYFKTGECNGGYSEGQLCYNSTEHKAYIYNSTDLVALW